MNEKLLHYIWKFQLFNKTALVSEENNKLQILSPGISNMNQGPDFLNSKIRINDTIWIGHVEIHINSSDWMAHRHSEDDNYKNIILHVVWNHDIDADFGFPTLVLKALVPKLLLNKYLSLMETNSFIPCEKNISNVKTIYIDKWKERMLMERLQDKSKRIESLLLKSNGDWEEVCWWIIANNFGGLVNADSFEMIAQSIPQRLLKKQSDSLFAIESIVFGQSGLLNRKFKEEYPNDLFREYLFHRKKYALRQPPVSLHFLRMRPANFPTIRLAQLCTIMFQEKRIFRRIIEASDPYDLKSILNNPMSEYWNTHYRFDEPGRFKTKKTGNQSFANFIINVAATLNYAYGFYHGVEKHKRKAIEWLEKTDAEGNTITGGFQKLGIINQSAGDSQALYHLKKNYCEMKKCLYCAIGNEIISKEKPVFITTIDK